MAASETRAAPVWRRARDGEETTRRPPFWQVLRSDWNGPRVLPFGAAIAVLAALTTAAYYVNRPSVPTDPDTSSYLFVAQQATSGHLFDPVRTPGYPVFIDLVSLLVGHDNLPAISIVQGVLYVFVSVGIYGLAYRMLHRAWAAFIVAVPVALNVLLISYVRPILTEPFAMFLLVGLALTLVQFTRAPRPRTLWLAMSILFILGMTRPEWVYFSVPLAGFAALISWKRDMLRRVGPHALSALLLFACLCGLYLFGNSRHGYGGFGENQNADLLGKVMQYHMQNEAPTQYAAITREVSVFVARGDMDPNHIIFSDPTLEKNRFALAAAYGRSIILRHPVEFVVDTIPVVFQSLRSTDPHQGINTSGPFLGILLALQTFANLVQYSLLVFPFVAIGWWIRLLRQRQPDPLTLAMSALSLICGFDLAVTTLFVFTQYARMNAPYDALMITVVWGTAITLATTLYQRIRRTRRAPLPLLPAYPGSGSVRAGANPSREE